MAAPAMLREPRAAATATRVAAPGAPATVRTGEQSPLIKRALAALDRHADQIARRDVVGVVDFAAHSREKRFALVDPASGKVSVTWLVAHGQGSDPGHTGWLESFSNIEGSNASSRGAFLVGEAYVGKYGRSRRLVGMEPDNDLALQRAIVMHGADYVSPELIGAQGRIGRSFGCFSVERHLIHEVMDRLPEGCLLFADRV